MIAVYLAALGKMYLDDGVMFDNPDDLNKAKQYLEEAKQVAESLHEWDNEAAICNNLAGCYELGLTDLATAAKYMGVAASVASPNNPMKQEYQRRSANMVMRLTRSPG